MASASPVRVRAWTDNDRAFYQAVVGRLIPDQTASPRDLEAMRRAMDRMVAETGSGTNDLETFIAVDVDDRPLGVIAVRPDVDYFTSHRRAYVEALVVADEAEGRGVGRALMTHAEAWGREHDCKEVVLDVFADNDPAIAFYRRVGYQPDHIRMTKPLLPTSDGRRSDYHCLRHSHRSPTIV